MMRGQSRQREGVGQGVVEVEERVVAAAASEEEEEEEEEIAIERRQGGNAICQLASTQLALNKISC